jgi:hypothetical protein
MIKLRSNISYLENEVKHPEEILREAQNDRCLQFMVQYSRVSLSLYCLDAIALGDSAYAELRRE